MAKIKEPAAKKSKKLSPVLLTEKSSQAATSSKAATSPKATTSSKATTSAKAKTNAKGFAARK